MISLPLANEWSVELPYDIHEHQHRFAAWAAASAAATIRRPFRVKTGVAWLVSVGLNAELRIQQLPTTESDFDEWHREMRQRLVEASQSRLTHGQAAKLINCYLKARFINIFSTELKSTRVAHPPIDALLLLDILHANLLTGDDECIIRDLQMAGWSNWSSDRYEQAIDILRSIDRTQPFWMIEKHWVGYR